MVLLCGGNDLETNGPATVVKDYDELIKKVKRHAPKAASQCLHDISQTQRYGASHQHREGQQFAFKSDHSTTMCTAVFTKTVSYFVERGSNVYACLLDVSKAFDSAFWKMIYTVAEKENACSRYSVVARQLFEAVNVC